MRYLVEVVCRERHELTEDERAHRRGRRPLREQRHLPHASVADAHAGCGRTVSLLLREL